VTQVRFVVPKFPTETESMGADWGRHLTAEAGNELRMSPDGIDDFWEDLLDFIEQGKVIPVIGEHAVTFGDDNEPLYPWLARELANRLEVTCAPLADISQFILRIF